MPAHDPLLKDLLRTFFRDFLGLVAPEIPAETFELLDKELIRLRPRRGKREVDLLARVRLAGGGALLVHVEIEAEHGAAMARRLWSYFLLLRVHFDEPVYTILINVRGGLPGLSRQTFEELTHDQARFFNYTVLGIGRSSAEELLARGEPLAWALAALTCASRRTRPALKLACLTRVATAAPALADDETSVLVNCIESYLDLTPEEAARFEALRAQSPAKEEAAVKAVTMTWADRMKSAGREEGRELGLQEGEERGARKILLQMLEQRFGQLPSAALQKLSEIGSASLRQLANQVLVARSLAEMGLE